VEARGEKREEGIGKRKRLGGGRAGQGGEIVWQRGESSVGRKEERR